MAVQLGVFVPSVAQVDALVPSVAHVVVELVDVSVEPPSVAVVVQPQAHITLGCYPGTSKLHEALLYRLGLSPIVQLLGEAVHASSTEAFV